MPIPQSSAGASAEPHHELVSELAALLDGKHAVYICLESRGAVFSVKSPEMVAFGETLITEWARLSPEDRARKVVEWIRKAATYSRKPRIRWKPLGTRESNPSERRSA